MVALAIVIIVVRVAFSEGEISLVSTTQLVEEVISRENINSLINVTTERVISVSVRVILILVFRYILAHLGVRARVACMWAKMFMRLVIILLGLFGYRNLTLFSFIIILLLVGCGVINSNTIQQPKGNFNVPTILPLGGNTPIPVEPGVKVEVTAIIAAHRKMLLDIRKGGPINNSLLLKLTLGHGAQAHSLGKLNASQWEQFQVYTQEIMKHM